MNKSELKTIWKCAKFFGITAFVLWMLETLFFLIKDGWHLKAITTAEVYLDEIVIVLFQLFIGVSTYVIVGLFYNFLKDKDA